MQRPAASGSGTPPLHRAFITTSSHGGGYRWPGLPAPLSPGGLVLCLWRSRAATGNNRRFRRWGHCRRQRCGGVPSALPRGRTRALRPRHQRPAGNGSGIPGPHRGRAPRQPSWAVIARRGSRPVIAFRRCRPLSCRGGFASPFVLPGTHHETTRGPLSPGGLVLCLWRQGCPCTRSRHRLPSRT